MAALRAAVATIPLLAGAAPAHARADEVATATLEASLAQAPVEQSRITARVPLEVPLAMNGRFLGTVSVEVDTAGIGAIHAPRLLDLVRQIVGPEVLVEIERRIAGRQKVEMAELSFARFTISFDPQTLSVNAQVPAAGVAETRLSVITREGAPDPAAYEPQEGFAAGLNIGLGQRYTHDGDAGFDPLQASLAGFVNIGGFDGVTLSGGVDYNGSDRSPWRRREFRATKDFYGSALRVTAGEFTPLPLGFQGAGRVAGLGVERAYSTIRPFQNIRPVGRQTFTIDRQSTVEVFVNDIRTETLLLEPGRYDISDFPFAAGPNRVRLEVDDPTGRREIASFDVFSDAELLNPGVTEFGAAIGLREGSRSQRYDGGPVATGFIMRGVANNFTLGGHAQMTELAAQAGLLAAWGVPLGFVQAEVAASRNGSNGRMGAALALDYRGEFSFLEANDLRVVISGFYRTRNFQDAFTREGLNPQRWQFAAQAQWRAPYRLSVGLGYFYARGRDRVSNQERIDLSLSRSFGRVSVNNSISRATDGERSDWRYALGISLRLGPRWNASARYDSRRGLKEAEISRTTTGALDDVSGEVRIGEDRDARGLSGRVAYINNRFDLTARHDRSVARSDTGASFANSSWSLATFIGFAGGQLALGRQSPEGFVIASRHPSLARSQLQMRVADRAVARTDAFGPALVPISRAYGLQRLETVIDPLPVGYDIGSGSVSIFPGFGAGYQVTVGSDASRTAIGTLVTLAGPVSLIGGSLERIDPEGAGPRPFFTNRSGRFVADGLAPGRYRIIIGGEAKGEFAIPQNEEGMINVGTITIDHVEN